MISFLKFFMQNLIKQYNCLNSSLVWKWRLQYQFINKSQRNETLSSQYEEYFKRLFQGFFFRREGSRTSNCNLLTSDIYLQSVFNLSVISTCLTIRLLLHHNPLLPKKLSSFTGINFCEFCGFWLNLWIFAQKKIKNLAIRLMPTLTWPNFTSETKFFCGF